jgi:hypothetical protein
MSQERTATAAASSGGPIRTAATDFGELVVVVVAVTAALLVHLAVFAFMASH